MHAAARPLASYAFDGVHHLETGNVAEQSFEALAVLRPSRHAATADCGDREWQDRLAAEHVLQLCGLIDDLVGGDQHEVHEHDVDDWPQAGDGSADAEANDRLFADGCVDSAPLAELGLDAVEGVEHAAVCADVFAGDEHVGVGGHLELDSLGECADVSEDSFVAHEGAPCSCAAV